MVLATILAGPVLAACGGSQAPPARLVSGPGFTFEAPKGWTVTRADGVVTAKDGTDFVQVARFPLLKPYTAALFDQVAGELKVRLAQVAGAEGVVEDAGEATVAGIRSHVYRIGRAAGVDEYTFVLTGRREYQLLCREQAAGQAHCARLQATFRLR